MKKLIFMILVAGAMLWACNKPEPVVEAKPEGPTPPAEFADPKFVETATKSLEALTKGDLDGFAASLADDAKFRWNNGDRIIGKKAIVDFWTDRRKNVIDTIAFSESAWLAIKAIDPPPHIPKAVYAFNWANFNITYATGKKVYLNIHTVYRFDDAGKIAEVDQYLDRLPIQAAMVADKGKKK